jgi:hypothetical protein
MRNNLPDAVATEKGIAHVSNQEQNVPQTQ